MGIILGSSLFIGVFIGVLISILLVATAVFVAVKEAKRRIHAWRVFLPVAVVSMTLLILGFYHYPYNSGTPGSNYSSLFGHFFFVGLAYAFIPGVASILAFLATFVEEATSSSVSPGSSHRQRLFMGHGQGEYLEQPAFSLVLASTCSRAGWSGNWLTKQHVSDQGYLVKYNQGSYLITFLDHSRILCSRLFSQISILKQLNRITLGDTRFQAWVLSRQAVEPVKR